MTMISANKDMQYGSQIYFCFILFAIKKIVCLAVNGDEVVGQDLYAKAMVLSLT